MHGVAASPLLGRGAGGSLPRLPYVRIAYIVAEVALVAPRAYESPRAISPSSHQGGGR
jgi:hypothetical protein